MFEMKIDNKNKWGRNQYVPGRRISM